MASAGGPAQPSHLVVGHVTRAHGTKGEVFVWPLTDQPDEVFATGRLLQLGDTEGQLGEHVETLEIFGVRPFKRGLLVSFRGLTDRNGVEAISGRYLLVPREELAPPGSDEIWYHQLMGLRVETVEGEMIGTVCEVYETAPADLIEVEGAEGRRMLVPATKNIIRRIDLDAGVLVIEPPEGLLEL